MEERGKGSFYLKYPLWRERKKTVDFFNLWKNHTHTHTHMEDNKKDTSKEVVRKEWRRNGNKEIVNGRKKEVFVQERIHRSMKFPI